MSADLYLAHPVVVASPYLNTEYRCSRCGADFVDGDVPDLQCLCCKTDTLVADALAAIDITGEGEIVRLLLRESEAPDFFRQLDLTLRVNFGVRLAAIEGCDEAVASRIGVAEPVAA